MCAYNSWYQQPNVPWNKIEIKQIVGTHSCAYIHLINLIKERTQKNSMKNTQKGDGILN